MFRKKFNIDDALRHAKYYKQYQLVWLSWIRWYTLKTADKNKIKNNMKQNQLLCLWYRSWNNFSSRSVHLSLLSMDIQRLSGPDGIPPIVLKMCAPELAPVLMSLVRLSYSSAVVPTSWKAAFVPPIPKKYNFSNP